MVVEIDEKSKIRFSKLENKSSFGGNCLIQGKSVLEVMGKSFKNIPEELTQTIKNVPSTNPSYGLTKAIKLRNRRLF